jgi:cytochrome P450
MTTTIHNPGANKMDEWLFNATWPQQNFTQPPTDSELKAIPGDKGMPLIGHSLSALRLGVDFALKRYEQYGPVSWMRAFGIRMVALGGPEAIGIALTNKDKAFTQQGWTELIGPFFRRGLMLLDFEEHLYHRRLMQQAFTAPRIAGYMGHVGDVVRHGVTAWEPDEKFLMYPALKQLTLDVASRVFMASTISESENAKLNRAFIDTVRAGTSIIRVPVPGGRWRAGLQGRKVLEKFFYENLQAKRASEQDDLFSGLCHAKTDDGASFSDEDVVNHMIFLMMAAHDTSTITTSAVTYFLGKYPQWQDKIREESFAAGDEPLDVAALERLHTLDLVIKESLRLVAPVPTMARKTIKDTEVLGHYIPANTMVALAPWVNHLLPEYWTDPYLFDPLRFSDERREDKVHRYAWMPFGGGVHKCIGMHFGMLEVKTLLHELVRNFRWEMPESYQVRWDTTSLPVPADQLPINLTRL